MGMGSSLMGTIKNDNGQEEKKRHLEKVIWITIFFTTY